MVSGQVAPPQLDLANEDLVRAHVHAIWLAETGLSLGSSLTDILDVSGEQPTLDLLRQGPGRARFRDYRASSARVLATAALCSRHRCDLREAGLVERDEWLDRVLDAAPHSFDARVRPLAGPLPLGLAPARAADASASPTPRAIARQERGEAPAPRGRGAARAAHRGDGPQRSRTSTATATWPAKASCPATTSRGCRSRRIIPGRRARQKARRVRPAPAVPGDHRVRAAQHHLPRGLRATSSTR